MIKASEEAHGVKETTPVMISIITGIFLPDLSLSMHQHFYQQHLAKSGISLSLNMIFNIYVFLLSQKI